MLFLGSVSLFQPTKVSFLFCLISTISLVGILYNASIKAKQIALSHAGLTSSQVTFKRTELDFDDGIQKYEVEFYYNNREY